MLKLAKTWNNGITDTRGNNDTLIVNFSMVS